MRNAIAVAALAAACSASPATAREEARRTTGFRAEVRAGADIARIDSRGEGGSVAGFDYSVEAGYDVGVGAVALGAYAGIGDSTAGACSEVVGRDRGCVRPGRDVTVGGRLGYPLGRRWLLFVKGGYSSGRARLSYRNARAPAFDFSDGEKLRGYHLGAGAEFGLGARVYLKGEYGYTDYAAGTSRTSGVRSDIDRHRVLGGVGIRF